jgi:signal peptidase I
VVDRNHLSLRAAGVIALAAAVAGCGGTHRTSATTGAGARTETLRVPSGAMEPTLRVGQHVSIDRPRRHPAVGQIVVFHPPAGADPAEPVCGDRSQGEGHRQPCGRPTARESDELFIKRVVAGPGDWVSIARDGELIRNGATERGYRIRSCPGDDPCGFPGTITLPSVEYYLLGDNRAASDDSRYWGPVRRGWIVGTVVAR